MSCTCKFVGIPQGQVHFILFIIQLIRGILFVPDPIYYMSTSSLLS